MSLVVRNLKKSYGDKVVVDNLSFEMENRGFMLSWEPTEQEKPHP